MQRLRPRVRNWLIPVAALVVAAACSEIPSAGGFQVTYRAGNSGLPQDSVFRVDSAFYTNASGRLVKVTAPASPWTQTVSIPPGTIVEGHVYATGRAARGAKFAALWMTADGALVGDSLTATTTANTAFEMHLPSGCTTVPAPDSTGVRRASCGGRP